MFFPQEDAVASVGRVLNESLFRVKPLQFLEGVIVEGSQREIIRQESAASGYISGLCQVSYLLPDVGVVLVIVSWPSLGSSGRLLMLREGSSRQVMEVVAYVED